MSTREEMRERWVAFMEVAGFRGPTLAQDAVKAALPFAQAEVALAESKLREEAMTLCSVLVEKEAAKARDDIRADERRKVLAELAPMGQAPGLAEAENVLRSNDACDPLQQSTIASELTRLRAEVARKSSALQDLVDAADEMLEQPVPEDATGAARVARLSLAILAALDALEKGQPR